MSRRRPFLAALAAPLLAGCGGDTPASEAATPAGQLAASHPGAASMAAVGYEGGAVAGAGQLRGRVALDGAAPGDTTVRPSMDQGACGTELRHALVESAGGGVGGAVVWLADVRRGRALPVERRYELAQEHCTFAPAVQSVHAGGTLNVKSADATTHRARFVRHAPPAAPDTLGVVITNDDGQVVPNEQVLARPGLIEVRCDLHPWSHGWVAAIAHPYHATTGPDGRFSLPDVPAGRYTLAVWHPRLGSATAPVVVTAGGTVDAPLTLRAR